MVDPEFQKRMAQKVRMGNRQFVAIFRTSCHFPSFNSSVVSAFVSFKRLMARANSWSVSTSLFGLAGVPGQTKTPAIATGIVIRALIINIHLQNTVRKGINCTGISLPPASQPSHSIEIRGRSALDQACS